MRRKLQNKNNPRGHRELFHTHNIPPDTGEVQEYTHPAVTPEIAIETFGESAREPVCNNIKHYCQGWYAKTAQIAELERIIATLPVVENGISLRDLYLAMLPRMKQELRQIERHIRRLQRCLELLEEREIFTKPAELPSHVGVAALKDRVNIADVISQWVELQQAGKLFKGHCPFHNDRSPSLVVYPETQSWHCFAGCGGGDVFTFVQKINNCGFREAAAQIQKL